MAKYKGVLKINDGEVGAWAELELSEKDFEFDPETFAIRVLAPAFAAVRERMRDNRKKLDATLDATGSK